MTLALILLCFYLVWNRHWSFGDWSAVGLILLVKRYFHFTFKKIPAQSLEQMLSSAMLPAATEDGKQNVHTAKTSASKAKLPKRPRYFMIQLKLTNKDYLRGVTNRDYQREVVDDCWFSPMECKPLRNSHRDTTGVKCLFLPYVITERDLDTMMAAVNSLRETFVWATRYEFKSVEIGMGDYLEGNLIRCSD